MPNENNSADEKVVEVSEQELADLGDFLAQVQIVLIGHEQRIGVLEQALFDTGANVAAVPDEGDSGSTDGSDEADEEVGPSDSGDGSAPSDA